jgi:hypothetical protein
LTISATTKQDVLQRTSHLLTRAMSETQTTVPELARRLSPGGASGVHKQLARILDGTMLPRIDTLTDMLDACGFDLVITIKRKVPDDED